MDTCCDKAATCTTDVYAFQTCCVKDGSQPSGGAATACCSQNGVDGNGACIPVTGVTDAGNSCIATLTVCNPSTDVCCDYSSLCQADVYGNVICCAPDSYIPASGNANDCCANNGVDSTGACLPAADGGMACIASATTCASATDICCDPGANCQLDTNGAMVCCIPDGTPTFAGNGTDCCSVGVYDPNTLNCGACAGVSTENSCTPGVDTCCDPAAQCAQSTNTGTTICCIPTGSFAASGNTNDCCSGSLDANSVCIAACALLASNCSAMACCDTTSQCGDTLGNLVCCLPDGYASVSGSGSDCCTQPQTLDASGNCQTVAAPNCDPATCAGTCCPDTTGTCVDTTTDPANCGSCGNSCFGLNCCSSACSDPNTDNFNCGSCGTACVDGTCTAGTCCIPAGSPVGVDPCCSGQNDGVSCL